MRLVLFMAVGLPLFLGWIAYRLLIKHENFKQVKDALFTGAFCFAVMGAFMYWLM